MLTRYYRDVHGLFASCAILYNHESPRRTAEYVTGKIVRTAVRIAKKLDTSLSLGYVDLPIDFGYAGDYVDAIWHIMQLKKPDDFVIGTGVTHTAREFMEEAFRLLGLDAYKYVTFNTSLVRPGKTSVLIADTTKAQNAFKFTPKVDFKALVKLLVDHELQKYESKGKTHS
jgi:GDPmannose 4,6-dehydratase